MIYSIIKDSSADLGVVVVVVEPLYISQFLFINETVSLSLKDLFLQ